MPKRKQSIDQAYTKAGMPGSARFVTEVLSNLGVKEVRLGKKSLTVGKPKRKKKTPSAKVPKFNIKMPKMRLEEWAVICAAMEYHEAEQIVKKGFRGAKCSGPATHWLGELHKRKQNLHKLCFELQDKYPEWRDALAHT